MCEFRCGLVCVLCHMYAMALVWRSEENFGVSILSTLFEAGSLPLGKPP